MPEVVLEIFNCPKLTSVAFDEFTTQVFCHSSSPSFKALLMALGDTAPTPSDPPFVPYRKQISRALLDLSRTHSFAIQKLAWPVRFGVDFLGCVIKSAPMLTTVD